MRYLALDVSDKRIGKAMAINLAGTIVMLQTYKRKLLHEDLSHLVEMIIQYSIDVLVIGQPINMNGSKGYAVDKINKFARRLKDELLKKSIVCKLLLVDERLSTFAASESSDMDAMAAKIILEQYFAESNLAQEFI